MQRIFLVSAAFAFALCATPVAAQQTQPDQSTQPAPSTQTTPPPETPPPFPPMPSARPTHRHVDVGEARAGHARHRVTKARAHHDRMKARHERAAPPSRATVRKCHAMSYKQIMRSDTCRALMQQELGASERNGKHRHKAARRHRHHRKG